VKRIDIKELVENFPKERTLSNEALKQKKLKKEREIKINTNNVGL